MEEQKGSSSTAAGVGPAGGGCPFPVRSACPRVYRWITVARQHADFTKSDIRLIQSEELESCTWARISLLYCCFKCWIPVFFKQISCLCKDLTERVETAASGVCCKFKKTKRSITNKNITLVLMLYIIGVFLFVFVRLQIEKNVK